MPTETAFKRTELPSGTLLRDFFANEDLEAARDRIVNQIDAADPLFDERHEAARRNSRFVAGDQWTLEDKEAHKKQNRIPYVFDQIGAKVSALIGTHASLRIDTKAVPQEPGDEIAVSIANRLIKWADQVNHIDEVEDQVFWDMVVKSYGVTQVRWGLQENLSGVPIIERIPIFQMRWDPASSDVGLKDAAWMSRHLAMTRQAAKEEMPEFAEQIDLADGLAMTGDMTYWEEMTFRQQQSLNYAQRVDELNGYVRVIQHYEKVRQYVYVLVDEIAGDMQEYDDKKSADDEAEARISEYMNGDEPVINRDGEERVQVVELTRQAVIQTIIIGDRAVSREVTELPDFPFQVAFCFFDDGDFWSFVDQLISPQIFINRMVSELDNQIGRTTKQMITVIPHRLQRGFTLENFNSERSKTAPTIPVQSHDAISAVPNIPTLPEIPQMIQMSVAHMTDIVGGKNALGLQENAAESGAAVRARQEAAGLSRMPIFQHLNMWRRRVTEMALWFTKNYMAAGQQIRIIGDAKEIPEWINIDTDTLDTLANTRVDIMVTEAIDSDTVRERQFAQMKELLMTVGNAIPPEMLFVSMLELSNLPEETKKKMLGQVQAIQEYNEKQAAQAEAEKMEKSVNDSIKRSNMKEQKELELASAQAQQNANPQFVQSTPSP